MTGDYWGTIDFGGGPLVSAGGPDVFVGKFDSDGLHVWSKRFGDASAQSSSAITTDGLGNVVIAGRFYGTIDFGGGPLSCSCVDTLDAPKLFVAKFDANGNHAWSKSFGDEEVHRINSVATDPSGNVLLTGQFRGTLDFGGGPLVGNDIDVFVAKLDVNGNHLWSERFGDDPDQFGSSIAVDAAGNVVISGEFLGTVDFGGGPITSTDEFDAFVAKFDSGGNHLWSKGFGGNADQFALSVATRMGGDVVITGHSGGDVDFGGGNLDNGGNLDVFLAQFDANGNHLWSHLFGGLDVQSARAIDTDGSGNVAITGNFAGTVDFGGGPLTCACNDTLLTNNIFVAQFDGDGNHLWSRAFGGPHNNSSNSVAADAAGSIVITGEFGIAIDFGGGPLAGSSIFLAKFREQTLPVLITSFDATVRGNAVHIAWDVWSDEAIQSYKLYRRDDAHSLGIVIAEGGFNHSVRSHDDANVEPGKTYYYELLVHAQSGADILSPVATVTVPLLRTTLAQNSPNPFRPTTTIAYTLGERSNVVVGIYDVAGRLVTELKQGVRDPGAHHVEWDGRDAAGRVTGSGVYFYRLEGAPRVAPKKMVRLK